MQPSKPDIMQLQLRTPSESVVKKPKKLVSRKLLGNRPNCTTYVL